MGDGNPWRGAGLDAWALCREICTAASSPSYTCLCFPSEVSLYVCSHQSSKCLGMGGEEGEKEN